MTLAETAFRLDEKNRPIAPLVCSADELARSLMKSCDWFTGVPDSVFKNVLPLVTPYLPSPRENHCVGVAFGARLGGKRPCILIQNSGLGLSGDALFGLFHLYKLGVLFVVACRGELEWEEAQHQQWGRQTASYLTAMELMSFDLQKDGLHAVTLAAELAFTHNKPSVLLVHRGNIDE